jgi:NADH-quinone oxidoreductase subunit J
MDIMQIIFFIIAAVSLYAALNVVTTNNLVHSALWLVLALFGIAGIYVLLSAGFFAVAQVLIYIGAIAILFIFAVMLTHRVTDESINQTNGNWVVAAILAAVFFGGMIFMFRTSAWEPFFATAPALPDEAGTLAQLGVALVGQYLLPFEMASVLLVAAMIGAVYVAWGKNYSPEIKED